MLYYVSDADIPGRQAHTIQQVQMCQAFQRSGENVCMIHPSYGKLRKQLQWGTVSEFYGLESKFNICTIPTLQSRFQSVPQVGLLSMLGFMTTWLSSRVFMGSIDSSDIIYGRNYYGLFLFNELRKLLPRSRCPTLVFETHTPISAHLKPKFYQSIDGMVCITNVLKDYMCKEYGLSESEILVAPDGVDLDPYTDMTKEEARTRIDLPISDDIIMYTGHLYEGKGVETLVEAAEGLDATVYIVGGYQTDINRVKQNAGNPENVVFSGFVEPSEIPVYQIAADVLVAPYTEDSRPWISPLKLFEYMAAGRPIVASDREVIQEVLVGGENALLFEKGDANALHATLRRVLTDELLANRLATAAQADVEAYTWERRAEQILEFIRGRQQ